MTRIICLANSWKHQERCIAGIDLATGRWVRPVTATADGSVPRAVRLVAGTEPAVLDVLEIPLSASGPDFGFESENRLILRGRWRRVGRVQPGEVRKYLPSERHILHTATPYVTVPFMRALPAHRRATLQLVETATFSVRAGQRRAWGNPVWKGSLTTRAGQRLTANITDPVFVRKLETGYQPGARCLVTVSIGMPWRPPDWEGDEPCWKLIAAVIELDADSSPPVTADDLDLADVPF